MTGSSAELSGRCLYGGTGSGRVLRLGGPLSFWGGVDETGQVIDRHHPQYGASVGGRVLAMTSGRGSSSSSSVLAELLRTGNGPAAIVLTEADAIITLGAIVADELYGAATPVVVVGADDYERLPDGVHAQVRADRDGAVIDWDA